MVSRVFKQHTSIHLVMATNLTALSPVQNSQQITHFPVTFLEGLTQLLAGLFGAMAPQVRELHQERVSRARRAERSSTYGNRRVRRGARAAGGGPPGLGLAADEAHQHARRGRSIDAPVIPGPFGG